MRSLVFDRISYGAVTNPFVCWFEGDNHTLSVFANRAFTFPWAASGGAFFANSGKKCPKNAAKTKVLESFALQVRAFLSNQDLYTAHTYPRYRSRAVEAKCRGFFVNFSRFVVGANDSVRPGKTDCHVGLRPPRNDRRDKFLGVSALSPRLLSAPQFQQLLLQLALDAAQPSPFCTAKWGPR